jgi:hypothetical protein
MGRFHRNIEAAETMIKAKVFSKNRTYLRADPIGRPTYRTILGYFKVFDEKKFRKLTMPASSYND